jgi:hypothetical protein
MYVYLRFIVKRISLLTGNTYYSYFFIAMANSSKKTDMILIFGECRQNSRNAARLYADRYPERYYPPHNYFARIVKSLREHGELPGRGVDGRRNGRPHESNEDEELQVLAYIHLNPRSSVTFG